VVGEVYRAGAPDGRGRWRADGQLELITAPVPRQAVRDREPGTAEPARTDTERALVTLLAAVLDVDEIGRDDDYFGLGGDSIMAVQIAARARDNGLRLTARMIFEHPTVCELAAVLDSLDTAEPDSGGTEHAPMSASGLSAEELADLTASWTAMQESS
jgi:mycobactin peptide synthetase MbtE